MISFNHLRCQFFCKMPLVKWVWGWKKESNFIWSTYLRVILRKTVAAHVKCANINFNIYAWRHMTYLWPDWKWKSHLAKSVHWVSSFATWPTFRIIFDWRILIPFFVLFFIVYANQNPKTCLFHASGIKKRENTVISIQKTFLLFFYILYIGN